MNLSAADQERLEQAKNRGFVVINTKAAGNSADHALAEAWALWCKDHHLPYIEVVRGPMSADVTCDLGAAELGLSFGGQEVVEAILRDASAKSEVLRGYRSATARGVPLSQAEAVAGRVRDVIALDQIRWPEA